LLSWNDGKAKQSVLAFVKQVTSPGSHGFVPPAERIATFDNDGTLFAAAAKAAPDDPRHTYIYAVALHDAGRRAEAIRLLETAAQRGGDRDVLLALASYKSAAGDRAGAEKHLRALMAINPDDPALAGLAGTR
jgi:tetratricopeptide (TPR) repeat protein